MRSLAIRQSGNLSAAAWRAGRAQRLAAQHWLSQALRPARSPPGCTAGPPHRTPCRMSGPPRGTAGDVFLVQTVELHPLAFGVKPLKGYWWELQAARQTRCLLTPADTRVTGARVTGCGSEGRSLGYEARGKRIRVLERRPVIRLASAGLGVRCVGCSRRSKRTPQRGGVAGDQYRGRGAAPQAGGQDGVVGAKRKKFCGASTL